MPDNTMLEASWAATIRQLHGLAASLADSKQRYEATKDARFLTSVANVLPLYRSTLAKAQDIARQLSNAETPSSLLLTLDTTSDWLLARTREVGEGVTGTIAGIGSGAQNIGDNAASLVKWLTVGVVVVAVAYAFGQAGPIVKALKAVK